MLSKTTYVALCAALAATIAPALRAQATPTCNGLPATIVATAPGQINGTAGDDVIVGSSGNDKIFGLGGNDTICGLGGNDQITGGFGADTLFGQAGNDTFLWSPGDGNDRIEGSSENDALLVSGSSVSETVELVANGNRLRLVRNIANIVLDIADVERVEFEARGGSDLVVVNTGITAGVQQIILDLEGVADTNTPDGQADSIIVFGKAADDLIAIAGSGNTLSITGAGPAIHIRNPEAALDTLSVYGSEGNDRISAENLAAGLVKLIIEGGPGNDTMTGSRGADALVGGEGDDTLVWTLGLPADMLAGEAGRDTLQVLGSGVAENVTISAGPLEAQISNAVDGATFPADVEEVLLQPKSGADQISITSLPGAALHKVTLDLRPSTTASGGDGHPDTITVTGATGVDNITITGERGSLALNGLTPAVVIQASDYARDTLTINSGFEADVVNASGLAADVIRLVLRGGPGSDVLTGSLGGDVFTWFPGDGSDVVDGRLGNDTLQVNGSAIGEAIGITANGSRLRFTRDIASIVLDVDAVERVTFAAVGGADTITFADLSATAVRQVDVDLAGPGTPAGDGQPDTLSINTVTSSAIATTLSPGAMAMTWAGVRFSITGVEPASDRLILQTATGVAPALISAVERENPDAEAGNGGARQ